MMFGSIMYEGIKMLKECEFDDRTMVIVSLAFAIGVGLTQTSGNFFSAFPHEVEEISSMEMQWQVCLWHLCC